jgi:outer membrane protein
MNLTYVLNTTTSSGDAIILYASDEAQEKYDITDQVMQQLGI